MRQTSIIFLIFITRSICELNEEERNCRPRYRLISTDTADLYTLVEAVLNSKLILQCHFCKENDDGQPKIWYKFDDLNSSSYEVKIGVHNNMSLNRIQVNFEHSLIITSVEMGDFGLYFCEGLEEQESENKFSYIIDVVLQNDVAPNKGNLSDWEIYHQEYILPVNKLFAISTESELDYIRSELQLKMEVITEWDVWGKCSVCGLPWDAEGIGRGWETGKSKGYKFKKSLVLAENAHVTFICPESSLENEVVWKKDGRVLQPGKSVEPSTIGAEPIITVDNFNTLYLYGVTSEESGKYTCQVDNIKMQQIKVFVVSKARLLTQAFVRHMVYLAFILCLTLPCYCGGLVILWNRRHNFKGYKELRRERIKKLRRKGRLLSEKEEEEDTSWMHS